MHDSLTFNSWFIWLLWAYFACALLGAALVLVSALRRPAADFGRLGRSPWLIVQTAFVAVSAFVFVAGAFDVPVELGAAGLAAVGLLLVAAVVQQIAYLLRVVFPSPKRAAARASSVADQAGGASVTLGDSKSTTHAIEVDEDGPQAMVDEPGA